MRLGFIEALLIQLLVYSLLYMADSYVGFLICLVALFIGAAIFILSVVFELIERSKVPKAYFKYLLSAVLAPLIVLIIFSMVMEGSFEWMKG